MSHETRPIQRFSQRIPNRNTGLFDFKGGNVFSRGDTLYSYGTHFPLARFLGVRKKKNLFVKNGDRYSPTTLGHQGETQRHCFGPTVSETALRAAGVYFPDIKLKNIVDFLPDSRTWVFRDLKTGKYYYEYDPDNESKNLWDYSKNRLTKKIEFKNTRQGQFIANTSETEGNYQRGCWHVLGAVLFYIPPKQIGAKLGSLLLASLDENRYFVSSLPTTKGIRTVAQAFKYLQPPEVQKAIRKGLKVLRQGEWFFVPTGLSDQQLATKLGMSIKKLKSLATMKPLPNHHNPNGNDHCCHWLSFVDGPAQIATYVRGKVFHRTKPLAGTEGKAPLSGEHKTVRLGENLDTWYLCYRNQELASWGQSGKFD